MKLQVFRLDHSDYFSPSFRRQEARELATLPGVKVLESLQERESSVPLALITNSQTQVGKYEKLFRSAAFIIHPNSGYDNFSYPFVQKVQIPILLGNEIRSHAVAHTALSTWLSYQSARQDTVWDRKWDRDLFNEKILIVGAGSIGTILLESLRELGYQVDIYDPFKGYHELPPKKWDVIFLACSLTASSYHFINKDFLSLCSEKLFLSNTARGECVCTTDLLEYLQEHPQAKAYLDVWENEPYDFELLKNSSQILTTSHKSGVFNQLEEKILSFEKKIIHNYLDGDLGFANYKRQNLLYKTPELFHQPQADFFESELGRLGRGGSSGGTQETSATTSSGSF